MSMRQAIHEKQGVLGAYMTHSTGICVWDMRQRYLAVLQSNVVNMTQSWAEATEQRPVGQQHVES